MASGSNATTIQSLRSSRVTKQTPAEMCGASPPCGDSMVGLPKPYALVTLMGDIGPWSDRKALVGGLAPRYIVNSIPADVPAHVGTADVDLVLGLSLGDADAEVYRTLQNNLLGSGVSQAEPSFRWTRMVDGVTVAVEFLGETSDVQPGRVFRPRGGSGSRLAALNVAGSSLAIQDSAPVQIAAARLDDGGESTVTIQVAGILSFVVLKILAFQDRHQIKDACDWSTQCSTSRVVLRVRQALRALAPFDRSLLSGMLWISWANDSKRSTKTARAPTRRLSPMARPTTRVLLRVVQPMPPSRHSSHRSLRSSRDHRGHFDHAHTQSTGGTGRSVAVCMAEAGVVRQGD